MRLGALRATSPNCQTYLAAREASPWDIPALLRGRWNVKVCWTGCGP